MPGLNNCPGGDDGDGAGIAGQATQPVGLVAFVAERVTHAPGSFEEAGAAFTSLMLPGVSISA